MSQQVGGHLITHIIKNNLENNVTIKLGNNKLIYSNGKRWILGSLFSLSLFLSYFIFILIYFYILIENSDLDVAATEIFNLTNENERLHNDLTITEQRCEMLEKQLKESQELKEIALALVSYFHSFILFFFEFISLIEPFFI